MEFIPKGLPCFFLNRFSPDRFAGPGRVDPEESVWLGRGGTNVVRVDRGQAGPRDPVCRLNPVNPHLRHVAEGR